MKTIILLEALQQGSFKLCYSPFFFYNDVLKFYKRYLCYCDRLHGEFFWNRELDL